MNLRRIIIIDRGVQILSLMVFYSNKQFYKELLINISSILILSHNKKLIRT